MKPKPEDFITEILTDLETGEQVEIKSWKYNTLTLDSTPTLEQGFVRIEPVLEVVPHTRLPTLRDFRELCRRIFGKTKAARGHPESAETVLRNYAPYWRSLLPRSDSTGFAAAASSTFASSTRLQPAVEHDVSHAAEIRGCGRRAHRGAAEDLVA